MILLCVSPGKNARGKAKKEHKPQEKKHFGSPKKKGGKKNPWSDDSEDDVSDISDISDVDNGDSFVVPARDVAARRAASMGLSLHLTH